MFSRWAQRRKSGFPSRVEVNPAGLVNKAVGHHIGGSHVRTYYCHPPPFLRLCLLRDERRPHSGYVNMKLAKTDLTLFQSAQGSEPIDIVLATQSSNTDFASTLSQAKTEGIEESAHYEQAKLKLCRNINRLIAGKEGSSD
jgi:hypothetical protein